MDWNKGFSSQYFASFVDPVTWKDMERLEITGGSASRNNNSLKESASIECIDYDSGERWIRIYLIATQNNTPERYALFTGLSSSPESNYEGYYKKNPVQLYSVLKPADDILLPRGWYAPYLSNGAELVKKLLSATPAPVIIEGISPNLNQSIVAENGETNLSMVNKILVAINWRIKITGDGTIIVCGKATEPSATYDDRDNDAIEPEIHVKHDWYTCPNVFRAVSGDLYAVARDESKTSPFSIPNRGREIWKEETSCNLNDNESLSDYSVRRLKELQQYSIIVTYDRRYSPNISASDIVHLNYPALDLVGDYMINSQTVEFGYGARTSEEVVKV